MPPAGTARPGPDRPGAQEWLPASADVESLARAVHDCRGCELWGPATQAVFSAGPDDAAVVVRIGAERGQVLDGGAHDVVVTTHPSALLRLRDRADYRETFDALVADLRTAAEAAG